MKMKKHKVIVLGILVVLFGMPTISHGIFYQSFGGRVTNTKATKIDILEKSGWTCAWFTGSLAINPVSGPRSYLTNSFINSTRTTPRVGQQVLGLYSMIPTPVTCIFPEPPATQIVPLPTINLPWGTSIR